MKQEVPVYHPDEVKDQIDITWDMYREEADYWNSGPRPELIPTDRTPLELALAGIRFRELGSPNGEARTYINLGLKIPDSNDDADWTEHVCNVGLHRLRITNGFTDSDYHWLSHQHLEAQTRQEIAEHEDTLDEESDLKEAYGAADPEEIHLARSISRATRFVRTRRGAHSRYEATVDLTPENPEDPRLDLSLLDPGAMITYIKTQDSEAALEKLNQIGDVVGLGIGLHDDTDEQKWLSLMLAIAHELPFEDVEKILREVYEDHRLDTDVATREAEKRRKQDAASAPKDFTRPDATPADRDPRGKPETSTNLDILYRRQELREEAAESLTKSSRVHEYQALRSQLSETEQLIHNLEIEIESLSLALSQANIREPKLRLRLESHLKSLSIKLELEEKRASRLRSYIEELLEKCSKSELAYIDSANLTPEAFEQLVDAQVAEIHTATNHRSPDTKHQAVTQAEATREALNRLFTSLRAGGGDVVAISHSRGEILSPNQIAMRTAEAVIARSKRKSKKQIRKDDEPAKINSPEPHSSNRGDLHHGAILKHRPSVSSSTSQEVSGRRNVESPLQQPHHPDVVKLLRGRPGNAAFPMPNF